MFYSLHDYKFDEFILEAGKIIFTFKDGFYAKDENEKECSPKKLLIKIFCGENNEWQAEEFVFVQMSKNLKPYKNISIQKFKSLLEKYGPFIVNAEFECKNDDRKIIKAQSTQKMLHFNIDIFDIEREECI